MNESPASPSKPDKQPSAARLAAEAAFSPPPRGAEVLGSPQVTFKRRKVDDAGTPPGSPGPDAPPASLRQARSPKTYRVEGAQRAAAPAPGDAQREPPQEARAPAAPVGAPLASSQLLRRLAAINAEIAALERQALEARRAEAASAVRWIKRAIVEYDLTADDLGL